MLLIIFCLSSVSSFTNAFVNNSNSTKLVSNNDNYSSSAIEQIIITSNDDFESFGFVGNGTQEDPFIIENLNFIGTKQSTIQIENTTASFVFRNNNLTGMGSETAIILSNVSNALITKNIIQNYNLWGIRISASKNIVIKDNFLENNTFGAIYSYFSKELIISQNAIHKNGYGVYFREEMINSVIEKNCFLKNTKFAIQLGTEGFATLNVENNAINDNSFFNNSLTDPYLNLSQASDWGNINIFKNNYWSDLIISDGNSDGINDYSYLIDSEERNTSFPTGKLKKDQYPLINDPVPHLKLPLILLTPNIEKEYSGLVKITWTKPDVENNNNIIYKIEAKSDGNWIIINDSVKNTYYLWDSKEVADGQYIIRISTLNVSTISEKPFNVKNGNENLFVNIILFLSLSFIAITGTAILFYSKSKTSNNQTFTEIVSLFSANNLRSFFNKIIVGIENAKLELIDETRMGTEIAEINEYTALANIYPDNLKNDMKSFIKGKSVLILTEIAYQPLVNSHSAYISDILDIPRQTVSDEIKRLLQLQYLTPVVNQTTLLDARFKYYKLTTKGILLLHLLKESIRVTLMQVHREGELSTT